jgi:hypothetical protein
MCTKLGWLFTAAQLADDYLQIRIHGRRVSETDPNTSAILRFAPAFAIATHWTPLL